MIWGLVWNQWTIHQITRKETRRAPVKPSLTVGLLPRLALRTIAGLLRLWRLTTRGCSRFALIAGKMPALPALRSQSQF
jgi:hypothetical protein